MAQKVDSSYLTLPIIAAILSCAFDLPILDGVSGCGEVVPASGALTPGTTGSPQQLYDVMQTVGITRLVLPAEAAGVVRKVMPKRERKGRVVGVDGLLPFVRAMLDEERCDPARPQALLEAA